jgi:hypothetical protein
MFIFRKSTIPPSRQHICPHQPSTWPPACRPPSLRLSLPITHLPPPYSYKYLTSFPLFGCSTQPQPLQRRQRPLLRRLIHNLAIFQSKDRDPAEIHLSSGVGFVELSDGEVVECRTSVCPAADPPADYVGARGEEGVLVGMEGEVREDLMEYENVSVY